MSTKQIPGMSDFRKCLLKKLHRVQISGNPSFYLRHFRPTDFGDCPRGARGFFRGILPKTRKIQCISGGFIVKPWKTGARSAPDFFGGYFANSREIFRETSQDFFEIKNRNVLNKNSKCLK